MKLLVIGFDGLDPFIVRDYKMFKEFTILDAVSPVPITGPAWTSLMTGLDVSTHGINEPWGRTKEGSKTFADMDDIYVWDYLNSAGLSCGLVNIPITWPPKAINRWMISGPFMPDRTNVCYPSDLINPYTQEYYPDLINEFFDKPEHARKFFGKANFQPLRDDPLNYSDFNSPGMLRSVGENEAVTMAARQMGIRLRTTSDICDEYPVDCLFFQDSFLDRLNHAFEYDPIYRDGLCKRLYEFVEVAVNELIDYFEPETCVIVSDHGGKLGRHENVISDSGNEYSMATFAIKNDNIRITDGDASKISCSIVDVVPTILFIVGASKAVEEKRFDGKVLYKLFVDAETTKAMITQQLKSLGYL